MKKYLLILLSVIMLLALVACGAPAETEIEAPETSAPETNALETNAPETNAPETEPGETECPHTDVAVSEKQATCDARGYYTEECKACGKVLKQETFRKTDCVPNGEATCTTASTCVNCGKELEAAKGHAFGEPIVVLSTCLADGSSTKTCSVCNESVVEVVPKIAHVMGVVADEKAATCSEAGYRKGACVVCEQEIVEELKASHQYICEGFFLAEDGTFMGTCIACGDVAPSEDIRVQLDFEMATFADEIAAQTTAQYLRPVDASNYWLKSAVITTIEDRSVMELKGSVSVDFDGELLYDASYFKISFDYYLPAHPQPEDPSNPMRATVFKFFPGFKEGKVVTPKRVEDANFLKYTFGKGWVFSQYGNLADIENGARVMMPDPARWYHMDFIVDNVTGEAYIYIDGEFITIMPTAHAGAFGVNESCDEQFDGYYNFTFGDGYAGRYKPLYDNFKITVLN